MSKALRRFLLLSLLGACTRGPEATVCDGRSRAHRVYNWFWGDLDERYAVFAERLTDATWEEAGAEACPALDDRPDDDELFELLHTLARHLDDGHTTLVRREPRRSVDGWVDVYPHYDVLYTAELQAEAHVLDGPLSWAANDWIAWGRIGSIGYLSLTSMDGLSPSGNENPDVGHADDAMDRVLADLADTDGMIVDVRANEGGWDAVSLTIARRFAGPRALAWSEQRRKGPRHDSFRPWRDTFVPAAPADAYEAPVVVLTSGGTFSAAETFTLAMRVRDQVTLLGESTSGHYSDMIDGELPNGWSYTFSGERYRAADGVVYEGRGTPVDVSVPLDAAALAAGHDNQLAAALELLR